MICRIFKKCEYKDINTDQLQHSDHLLVLMLMWTGQHGRNLKLNMTDRCHNTRCIAACSVWGCVVSMLLCLISLNWAKIHFHSFIHFKSGLEANKENSGWLSTSFPTNSCCFLTVLVDALLWNFVLKFMVTKGWRLLYLSCHKMSQNL